jgi:Family of unknown function (DUF6186)
VSWRHTTFLLWSVLVVTAVGLAVTAHRGSRRSARPPARPGSLWSAAMRNPFGRALVLLGWMWLGWHFFAR